MSGRAWVSLLLIATLTGCASRSRPKPCLTRTAHWMRCQHSTRLRGGQVRFLAGFFPGLGRAGSSMHIIAGRCPLRFEPMLGQARPS
jgi:hypothetical protein